MLTCEPPLSPLFLYVVVQRSPQCKIRILVQPCAFMLITLLLSILFLFIVYFNSFHCPTGNLSIPWSQIETDGDAGDGEAAAAGAATDEEAATTAAVQPDAIQPAAAAAAEPDEAAKLEALEKEAKEKGLGKLYAACGGGEEGLRACVAIEALCEVGKACIVHVAQE